MSEKKLFEVATSLLLFKIQFDKRYNSVTEIIESEQWEEYERLKGSVDNGIMLAGNLRSSEIEGAGSSDLMTLSHQITSG